jgi:hypothetical protein
MSRSSTTSIHRATVGEAKTSCGIVLASPVGEPCAIPTLCAGTATRTGRLRKVKVVTLDDFVDCGTCLYVIALRARGHADEPKGATS